MPMPLTQQMLWGFNYQLAPISPFIGKSVYFFVLFVSK